MWSSSYDAYNLNSNTEQRNDFMEKLYYGILDVYPGALDQDVHTYVYVHM